MELTTKQSEGLKIAIKRYLDKEKITVISGYAGTGKSTLVKFIISALADYGIDPEKDVVYCSFTGKATQVLQRKGNRNVSTLHKLLYETFPLPDGKFRYRPKLRMDYKVVVVDEVSMAPLTLMNELAKHQCYVIALGDNFQLPPVNPKEDNHLLDSPHIFLDEVMRQAQDSGIIRLSMDVRAGNPLQLIKENDVIVMDKKDLTTDYYMWADQILCAKNNTRTAINNQMRKLLGRGDMPEEGDKVICLRNSWDQMNNINNPLVNGTIGYLKNIYSQVFHLPKYLGGNIDIISSDVVDEDGNVFNNLDMDKKLILEGVNSLTPQQLYKIRKNKKYSFLIPEEFTYGYAITTHKSQGSEWDKVLVIEESFPFDREEHARWIYTALTRSAKRLIIVRK